MGTHGVCASHVTHKTQNGIQAQTALVILTPRAKILHNPSGLLFQPKRIKLFQFSGVSPSAEQTVMDKAK